MFLRTNKESQKFRGFLVMAEADGDRGHGYFVPAKDSLDLVKAVNCASLPASCEEDDSCQGTSNAMTHNSGAEKEAVTLIWTPPSKFSGKVSTAQQHTARCPQSHLPCPGEVRGDRGGAEQRGRVHLVGEHQIISSQRQAVESCKWQAALI